MRNHIINSPRSVTFLLVGILSLLLLGFLVKSYSPNYTFSVYIFHVSTIIPFFILLFFTLSGIFGFILKSKIQGIVVGIFVDSYLFLRILELTNWFFLIMLLLLFIVVELFIIKAK